MRNGKIIGEAQIHIIQLDTIRTVQRDMRNLGLESSSLAQICRETALSLEHVARNEFLFVVENFHNALRDRADGLHDRARFYSDIIRKVGLK